MDSRIWSAVFVHTNGRASSFQVLIQARMSELRARTERCAPRRSFLVVSSANQRSTRFSHELDVGVSAGEACAGPSAAPIRSRPRALREVGGGFAGFARAARLMSFLARAPRRPSGRRRYRVLGACRA